MNKPICFIRLIPIILLAFSLYSCKKKGTIEEVSTKTLIQFSHLNKGNPLLFDTMIYRTSLGNDYMVNDLKYFISKVQMHHADGKWIQLTSDEGIHYIDARDNSTLQWELSDRIPAGTYDTVRFVFGLDGSDNKSFRFPDPPERDMFWPLVLGGGYHYMMLNLKWKNDSMQDPRPFMFHLGIGQIYSPGSTDTDSILAYVQNYFNVTSLTPVTIAENDVTVVNVIMNVDKWFDGPYAFDFSAYPMGIMQYQDGIYKACMNGRKAFLIQ
jgi:hypothetical protein